MRAAVRWGVLWWLLVLAGVAYAQPAADDQGSGSASASGSEEASASAEPQPQPEPEAAKPEPEDVPQDNIDNPDEDDAQWSEADEEANDPLGDEPAVNSPAYLEEYGEPYVEADFDGDGKVSDEEAKEEHEADDVEHALPDEIEEGQGLSIDLCAAWPMAVQAGWVKGDECQPVEMFRALVRFAKKKVLPRLEAKVEMKAQERMAKVSMLIFFVSLAGLLLVFTPLFVGKKYPGKAGVLWKYSALSAFTFFLTVNLFGAVLMTLRGTQSLVSKQTNPQLVIAGAFFDTLDHDAGDFSKVSGLFGPALKHMQGATDEQPTATVIANGQRLIKDAQVFVQIAKMFKRVSFVFGVLPIVLLGVTILLFVLAIKPTLIEIAKMPMHAAEGGNAGSVVKSALGAVFNEAKATAATIVVLIFISVLAGFILGKVVEPALESLLTYFALTVIYLLVKQDASSGLVFGVLFSVIFFLVLNLAVVILSMSFYLGKAQKIFQQRFTDKVPLGEHARFWKWGTVSVVWAQLFPWLYILVAHWAIDKYNDKILDAGGDVSWTQLMLGGPVILVVGFLIFLWATQGVRSLMFLAKYKPKTVLATYRSKHPVGA